MFKYVEFGKVSDEFTTHSFRGNSEEVEVISFDADVVALKSKNEAIIDTVIAFQNALINAVEIPYDEFKSIVQTTAQYVRVKQRVEEEYNKDVSVITSIYPLAERETWVTQLAEAKAFKVSNKEGDAPFLKTLADAEGGTVLDFADAVIGKSESYLNFMAVTLANKRAYEKELMSELGL